MDYEVWARHRMLFQHAPLWGFSNLFVRQLFLAVLSNKALNFSNYIKPIAQRTARSELIAHML